MEEGLAVPLRSALRSTACGGRLPCAGPRAPLHVSVSGEVRIVHKRTIASLDLTKKDLPAAPCGNHNREVRCSTPESMRDLFEQQDVPLTLAHAKIVKAIAYAKVKTD